MGGVKAGRRLEATLCLQGACKCNRTACCGEEVSMLRFRSISDLFWPFGGSFFDTWRALETIHREGRARAIGVSNFLVHHLEELLESAQVPPMVNQVEHHARLQQTELRSFCRQKGIQYEAWRPLMGGSVGDIPALQSVGEKYAKTPFQVALRWMVQDEIVTIPKSVHRDRMEANADIFDFELAADDVAVIDALDEGSRFGPHPDEFRPNPA